MTFYMGLAIYLRYQDFSVPSNINEKPEDYNCDRELVTLACHPGEAYFVIRDTRNPDREMTDLTEFANLCRSWNQSRVRGGPIRWTSLAGRKREARIN